MLEIPGHLICKDQVTWVAYTKHLVLWKHLGSYCFVKQQEMFYIKFLCFPQYVWILPGRCFTQGCSWAPEGGNLHSKLKCNHGRKSLLKNRELHCNPKPAQHLAPAQTSAYASNSLFPLVLPAPEPLIQTIRIHQAGDYSYSARWENHK